MCVASGRNSTRTQCKTGRCGILSSRKVTAMAIISISRELGARGEETAGELSSLTGFRILDREYFEKRLAEHGLGPGEQERYDEKKPGFWSSLSDNWSDYLHYLRLTMYEEAAAGNCIIMGRGGAAVFSSVPNHLAIRITAPLGLRVERTMRQYSCDERQARHLVEHSDHDRSGFSRINFSTDWADPRLYDLCVNTAKLDAGGAAKMIKDWLAAAIDAGDEAAAAKSLRDLLLSQRVLTEILCVKKLRLPNLNVSAEDGAISLDGLANTKSTVDAAVDAAQAVPGVREVKNCIHLVQEYTVGP